MVAHSANRVIGLNNDIPWRGLLPADMRHFKELTTGHAVIMGRLTFESIGQPLINRRNIVISRKTLEIAGCAVVPDLASAFSEADTAFGSDSFVIGGAQVYAEAIAQVDALHVTEIDINCTGDAFFPELGDEWVATKIDEHSPDAGNRFNYRFVTYQRKASNQEQEEVTQ